MTFNHSTKKITIFIFASALVVVACTKSNLSNNSSSFTTDCSTSKSWATDVSPVIQSYCAVSGCHASGSKNGPGALTTYTQVYSNSSAIRTAVVNGTMPQGMTLTSAQKNAIVCWIDNGATNN